MASKTLTLDLQTGTYEYGIYLQADDDGDSSLCVVLKQDYGNQVWDFHSRQGDVLSSVNVESIIEKHSGWSFGEQSLSVVFGNFLVTPSTGRFGTGKVSQTSDPVLRFEGFWVCRREVSPAFMARNLNEVLSKILAMP